MPRPHTLVEVARRRNAGEDFSLLLREFLDEFYSAVRRGRPPRALQRTQSVCLTCENTPRSVPSVNIWLVGGTFLFRRGRTTPRGFCVAHISRRRLKDSRRYSSPKVRSPSVAV